MNQKVDMNSVSTKTGDRGESGLANGQRLNKGALIFEVLGTQDELNSWIGMVGAQLPDHFAPQKKFLLEVQEMLFRLGAELAAAPRVKLTKDQLTKLEQASNSLQKKMVKGWTTKFLYPGGNEAAARLDVTRTVCRRLERLIVRYSSEAPVSPLVLQYINRLSDYLYVLRCFVNHEEKYIENKFESNTL